MKRTLHSSFLRTNHNNKFYFQLSHYHNYNHCKYIKFNHYYQNYNQYRNITSHVTKAAKQIDSNVHPRIQTLFFGFISGIIFISLYNKEWPGYYRRLLRKAKKGDSNSQVELGELLIEDEKYKNQTRSKKRAFQWFSAASEQGNQRAHYYLGLLHKNNDLEASNPKAAFYHFNCASLPSDKNNEITGNKYKNNSFNNVLDRSIKQHAKYELAICYLSGYGVDRDLDKGMEILEQIGNDGSAKAAAKLCEVYTNGRYGIPMNSIRGLSWKKEASRLGDKQSQKEMTELYISKGKDLIDKSIVSLNAFQKKEAKTDES